MLFSANPDARSLLVPTPLCQDSFYRKPLENAFRLYLRSIFSSKLLLFICFGRRLSCAGPLAVHLVMPAIKSIQPWRGIFAQTTDWDRLGARSGRGYYKKEGTGGRGRGPRLTIYGLEWPLLGIQHRLICTLFYTAFFMHANIYLCLSTTNFQNTCKCSFVNLMEIH